MQLAITDGEELRNKKFCFVIGKIVLHFFQNLSRASTLKGVATSPQAPNLGTTFWAKVVNHVLGQSVNHVPLDSIITPTTKERMEELEAEKSELSIRIMKEEMSRPKLTREEILYWFYKFRKLNPKKLDHRRTLINNFVNSVFLFEDKMIITFNFKDGTETITFADLEKSELGSDFKVSGAPKRTAT